MNKSKKSLKIKVKGIEYPHYLPGAILFTYLFTGFYAIIVQTILFRELLVVAMGNEIILGISLFNWLIGVFGGALVGGYLIEKMTGILKTFLISLLVFILLTPLSITFIRLLYHVSNTPAGSYIHFFKVFYLSALSIVPLSFFIGFTFPVASKIHSSREYNHLRKITFISRVYIFEALGSLLGGCIVSFLLVGHFNSYFIVSLASLPLLCLMAFNGSYARRKTLFLLITVLFLLESLFLILPGHQYIDNRTSQKRWEGFSHSELIWTRDSHYQNLALGKILEQFNLFSNGQFTTSFPEDQDNMIRAAHLISQHPKPERILIIGEALSGLAKSLLVYDIKKLQSIELDRTLVNGISQYLPESYQTVFSDNRFSIQIKDGRKYLGNNSSENSNWDIIFVNIAEPSTLLLNRFYTLEFFKDASRVMAPDGIISLRITSSENYAAGMVSQYTACIFHTLKRVFPYIVVAPGDQNFFFACKVPGIISSSAKTLSSRYIKTKAQPKKLALIFPSLYPEEKTTFILKSLQSQTVTSLNTDEKPVSVLYFNKILGWTSGSQGEPFFSFFEKTSFHRILYVILMLFFLGLAFVFIKAFIVSGGLKKNRSLEKIRSGIIKSLTSRFNIIYVVICGGFSGISLELLVVYSFQNIYGYVYQLIGFIVALFMTGLPLGATIATGLLNRKNRSNQKPLLWLFFIQVCFIALSLIFPALLQLIPGLKGMGKGMMFLFIILIGVLVGAIFPLALHLYAEKYPAAGRAAGMIDASDHLGAAIGAFFTGAILLPILGITGITHLIAIFSTLAILLLLLNASLSKSKCIPPHH